MLFVGIIITVSAMFLIRKKILNRAQAQSSQSPVTEESALYEEIDSRRPQMIENMAYSMKRIQK